MPKLTDTLAGTSKRNPKNQLKKFTNYVKAHQFNNKRHVTAPFLGNSVKVKNDARNQKHCSEQMSELLGCWKMNGFKENVCLKEVERHNKCLQEVEKHIKDSQAMKKYDTIGVQHQDSNLTSKQANVLLRMYPQPPKEINITHYYGSKLDKPYKFQENPDSNTIDARMVRRKVFKMKY